MQNCRLLKYQWIEKEMPKEAKFNACFTFRLHFAHWVGTWSKEFNG